jgi:hypothetical protein
MYRTPVINEIQKVFFSCRKIRTPDSASAQDLLLIILATPVRNTLDENEMRIILEYLSQSSFVFPKVCPVIKNLLDVNTFILT